MSDVEQDPVSVPEIPDGEQAATGDMPESEESATSEVAEGDAPEGDEVAKEPTSEPPKGVKKRLDELTRLRYEAKREAERERQEREYWQRKALGLEDQQPTAANSTKPAVEQFTTYEEYLEALTDWKVEQREAERERRVSEQSQAQTQQTKVTQYQQRVAKVADKYPDYEEIAHGLHWSPTAEMADAIRESDIGPDIAYYLGSNPDVAERISGLPPLSQIRELGRLEERLSRPAPKPVSQVPPPIEPSGPKAKASKEPWEMTPTEFAKWREKFINQRR